MADVIEHDVEPTEIIASRHESGSTVQIGKYPDSYAFRVIEDFGETHPWCDGFLTSADAMHDGLDRAEDFARYREEEIEAARPKVVDSTDWTTGPGIERKVCVGEYRDGSYAYSIENEGPNDGEWRGSFKTPEEAMDAGKELMYEQIDAADASYEQRLGINPD